MSRLAKLRKLNERNSNPNLSRVVSNASTLNKSTNKQTNKTNKVRNPTNVVNKKQSENINRQPKNINERKQNISNTKIIRVKPNYQERKENKQRVIHENVKPMMLTDVGKNKEVEIRERVNQQQQIADNKYKEYREREISKSVKQTQTQEFEPKEVKFSPYASFIPNSTEYKVKKELQKEVKELYKEKAYEYIARRRFDFNYKELPEDKKEMVKEIYNKSRFKEIEQKAFVGNDVVFSELPESFVREVKPQYEGVFISNVERIKSFSKIRKSDIEKANARLEAKRIAESFRVMEKRNVLEDKNRLVFTKAAERISEKYIGPTLKAGFDFIGGEKPNILKDTAYYTSKSLAEFPIYGAAFVGDSASAVYKMGVGDKKARYEAEEMGKGLYGYFFMLGATGKKVVDTLSGQKAEKITPQEAGLFIASAITFGGSMLKGKLKRPAPKPKTEIKMFKNVLKDKGINDKFRLNYREKLNIEVFKTLADKDKTTFYLDTKRGTKIKLKGEGFSEKISYLPKETKSISRVDVDIFVGKEKIAKAKTFSVLKNTALNKDKTTSMALASTTIVKTKDIALKEGLKEQGYLFFGEHGFKVNFMKDLGLRVKNKMKTKEGNKITFYDKPRYPRTPFSSNEKVVITPYGISVIDLKEGRQYIFTDYLTRDIKLPLNNMLSPIRRITKRNIQVNDITLFTIRKKPQALIADLPFKQKQKREYKLTDGFLSFYRGKGKRKIRSSNMKSYFIKEKFKPYFRIELVRTIKEFKTTPFDKGFINEKLNNFRLDKETKNILFNWPLEEPKNVKRKTNQMQLPTFNEFPKVEKKDLKITKTTYMQDLTKTAFTKQGLKERTMVIYDEKVETKQNLLPTSNEIIDGGFIVDKELIKTKQKIDVGFIVDKELIKTKQKKLVKDVLDLNIDDIYNAIKKRKNKAKLLEEAKQILIRRYKKQKIITNLLDKTKIKPEITDKLKPITTNKVETMLITKQKFKPLEIELEKVKMDIDTNINTDLPKTTLDISEEYPEIPNEVKTENIPPLKDIPKLIATGGGGSGSIPPKFDLAKLGIKMGGSRGKRNPFFML